jgi:hypothetical protein
MFLDVERYQYYMLDFKGNRIYADRGKTYKPEAQKKIQIPRDGQMETTSEKLRRLATQNPF